MALPLGWNNSDDNYVECRAHKIKNDGGDMFLSVVLLDMYGQEVRGRVTREQVKDIGDKQYCEVTLFGKMLREKGSSYEYRDIYYVGIRSTSSSDGYLSFEIHKDDIMVNFRPHITRKS